MSYLDIVRHCKWSDLSPDHGNEFGLGGGGEGGAIIHGDKAVEGFPLHWVGHGHHSCLSNILVLNQNRLNLCDIFVLFRQYLVTIWLINTWAVDMRCPEQLSMSSILPVIQR